MRRIKQAILIAFLIPAVQGCDQMRSLLPESKPVNQSLQNPTQDSLGSLPKAPPIGDVQSPDTAVKAWWAFVDYRDQLDFATCNQIVKAASEHLIPHAQKIAQGDLLVAWKRNLEGCRIQSFSREIKEVKNESETRALVFATIKNVTPITRKAPPNQYEAKAREEGVRYRYLVEKSPAGWKISAIHQFDEVSVTLKTDPWRKVYAVDDDGHFDGYVGNPQ